MHDNRICPDFILHITPSQNFHKEETNKIIRDLNSIDWTSKYLPSTWHLLWVWGKKSFKVFSDWIRLCLGSNSRLITQGQNSTSSCLLYTYTPKKLAFQTLVRRPRREKVGELMVEATEKLETVPHPSLNFVDLWHSAWSDQQANRSISIVTFFMARVVLLCWNRPIYDAGAKPKWNQSNLQKFRTNPMDVCDGLKIRFWHLFISLNQLKSKQIQANGSDGLHTHRTFKPSGSRESSIFSTSYAWNVAARAVIAAAK